MILALVIAVVAAIGVEAQTPPTDRLWDEATRAYDRDDYAAAATAFTRLTEVTPEDGTAWAMRGLCEYRLGKADAALSHINKGRVLGIRGGDAFRNVLRYHEGVLLNGKGEFERAQETLASLAAETESEETVFALGMSVLRALPAELPQLPPRVALAIRHAGIAEQHVARREPDDALRAYQALSLTYPEVRNTAYALGRHLLTRREPEPAADAFMLEIKRFPDHVPARLSLAAAKSKAEPAVALRYAEEAVALNPRVPLGHYLLGSLLLDTPDTARAIAELELAAQEVTTDPGVYYALSRAYTRAGRTEDAARARKTFLRLSEGQQRPNGGAQ